jgi:hypothetical protein
VPQTTFNVGYVAVESVPVLDVVVVALPPLLLLLPPQALTTSASPAATTVAIATDLTRFILTLLHLPGSEHVLPWAILTPFVGRSAHCDSY